MRITDVETVLLSHPVPDEHRWRLGGTDGPGQQGVKVDLALVRVHTADGLVGAGEPTPYAGARTLRDAVDRIEPHLVGEDPFDVDCLAPASREAYMSGHERYAMAGVDQACWDLMGKATGQPVSKLLGGQHAERVPVYASGGIDWRFLEDPDLLVDEAEGYLEEGFTAFKFRVGPDERFVPAVEALVEAVGDEMDLIVEGNARFDSPAEAAAQMGRFREVGLDPHWFEEPIDTTDRAGYRDLRARLPDVRISGGESKESASEFKPWVDDRAYDIVQPDCNVLGITEGKRVADLARVEGLPCVPHNWHNAVNAAANLHLAAALPNREVLELQRTWHWSCPAFREDVVEEPLEFDDGHLVVPDSPGLGVELDEDALERYPYEPGPVFESWEGV